MKISKAKANEARGLQRDADLAKARIAKRNAKRAKPCPHCGSKNDFINEHSVTLVAPGANCICGACGRDYIA